MVCVQCKIRNAGIGATIFTRITVGDCRTCLSLLGWYFIRLSVVCSWQGFSMFHFQLISLRCTTALIGFSWNYLPPLTVVVNSGCTFGCSCRANYLSVDWRSKVCAMPYSVIHTSTSVYRPAPQCPRLREIVCPRVRGDSFSVFRNSAPCFRACTILMLVWF